MLNQNNSAASCTKGGERNFINHGCNDAILESSKFKSDVLFFYANVAYAVIRSVLNFLMDYGAIILLSVTVVLLVFLVYKSFWNPISYVKVSELLISTLPT